MITTAPEATRAPRARGTRAFTLVEFMIGSALGSMVLLATLTAFIFFCRGGVSMSHYADMERQSRVTLQTFSQDARQASGVVWVDENTLRLTLNGTTVTYGYRAQTKDFVRTTNATTQLITSLAHTNSRLLERIQLDFISRLLTELSHLISLILFRRCKQP